MNDPRTEEDVRGFLRLCLDPGRGVERAPLQLTKVMPQALRDAPGLPDNDRITASSRQAPTWARRE
ncbi:hypothetical protein ACWGJX_24295 [Streptomyces sp. NPDC054775]